MRAAWRAGGGRGHLAHGTEAGKETLGVSDLNATGADLLTGPQIRECRAALLGWYDRARRALPWRALPGEKADPYRVWLSEIMLQQTTIAAVIPYFLKFTEKWPRVQDLAAAAVEDVLKEWAGLGYYARARNLYKCAGVVTREYRGCFPADVAQLRALPGIGDYTAGAIAAIAFDIPAMALDGNAERVFVRYFDISEPFPAGKKAVRAAARPAFEAVQDGRAGDFVQAVMDLGSTVCTPKNPSCAICPLAAGCRGRKAGHAASLPVRQRPAEKPRRFGEAYVIRDNSGHILVERRPEGGLLGGMLGLPTSEWLTDPESPETPPWLRGPGFAWEKENAKHRVFHTFTHFHLDLRVRLLSLRSNAGDISLPPGIFRMRLADDPGAAMPSVFRKVFRLFEQES